MNFQNRMGQFVIAGLVLAGLSTGCQNMNKTQTGAALGAGLGGLTGAIIGHQSGNGGKGALIGAAAGGLGGGLLGNAQDKADQRDQAIRRTQQVQQTARENAVALTNRDVVNLTQNQISDTQIIQAIRQRGGRFDTSSDGLIYLKQQGVSPDVVAVMQQGVLTH
jgi:uncharacterized protein YcfJ